MLDIHNIQQLAQELDSEILAKVIFSFGPDIILSPLALPREILEDWIADTADRLPDGALKDVVLQLRNRATFQEQWPDTYQDGLRRGKARMQRIDRLRNSAVALEHILQKDARIHEWYSKID
jgi:hypothetical protein